MVAMTLKIVGQLDGFTSWGILANQAYVQLGKYFYTSFHPTRTCRDVVPPPEVDIWRNTPAHVVLQITPIDVPVEQGAIVWTMHESSMISREAADNLNRAALVITPCEWVRKAFIDSGVVVPIKTVPLGFSESCFYKAKFKPMTDGPVFGTAGSLTGAGERKNIQAIVDAFHQSDANASLKVKVMPWETVDTHGDQRISVKSEFMTDGLLGHWFRTLDCYVTASRGEGFGLMPLQAMACGCKVVAPVYSGHAAYMGTMVEALTFDIGPATGFYTGQGLQCYPHFGHLKSIFSLISRNNLARHLPTPDQISKSVSHLTWSNSLATLRNTIHEFKQRS